jgi:hypothetical protein
MSKYLPGIPEVSRETVTVIAGALLAAFIISQFPTVKKWIKDQWT